MADHIALNNPIDDAKIFDTAFGMRKHIEERRDEMNKYYTSLFTLVISAMPFLEKFLGLGVNFNLASTKIFLVIVSFIMLIQALSWVFALKYIYSYVEGCEKLIISLEEKYNAKLIGFISSYLQQTNAPEKITKQEMWVPYGFTSFFMCSFLYFLVKLFGLL